MFISFWFHGAQGPRRKRTTASFPKYTVWLWFTQGSGLSTSPHELPYKKIQEGCLHFARIHFLRWGLLPDGTAPRRKTNAELWSFVDARSHHRYADKLHVYILMISYDMNKHQEGFENFCTVRLFVFPTPPPQRLLKDLHWIPSGRAIMASFGPRLIQEPLASLISLPQTLGICQDLNDRDILWGPWHTLGRYDYQPEPGFVRHMEPSWRVGKCSWPRSYICIYIYIHMMYMYIYMKSSRYLALFLSTMFWIFEEYSASICQGTVHNIDCHWKMQTWHSGLFW